MKRDGSLKYDIQNNTSILPKSFKENMKLETKDNYKIQKNLDFKSKKFERTALEFEKDLEDLKIQIRTLQEDRTKNEDLIKKLFSQNESLNEHSAANEYQIKSLKEKSVEDKNQIDRLNNEIDNVRFIFEFCFKYIYSNYIL